MLLTFLLSPPLLAQQITDTGWKVVNKDVYKKDTSGKVVIGNTEIKEKLNIGGNLRIDGLKGSGYRDVIVDKEGKLHPGRPYLIPPEWTGAPDDVNIPDNLWRPDPTTWAYTPDEPGHPDRRPFCSWSVVTRDFLSTLCPVGIGVEDPGSMVHVFGMGGSDYNPMLRLSNKFYDGTTNEPSILFDDDTLSPTVTWRIGAQVTGEKYFRINLVESNEFAENQFTEIDKEFFRITRDGKVGIGTDNPQAELEISSPGFYYANTLPIIRNTGNGGAGFRFIPGGNAKEWFIHATGPANSQGANKLVFKTIDTTTAMTLTTLGGVKAEIFGDLNVTGNITSSSPLGINITGNIETTGYLKSGNSIIIDGGTSGANTDNIIYSTTGTLSFGNGEPGSAVDFYDIKVGIGVAPLTDYNLYVPGSVKIGVLSVVDDFFAENGAEFQKGFRVYGTGRFNGDLEVNGVANFNNLEVNGVSNFNNTLNVKELKVIANTETEMLLVTGDQITNGTIEVGSRLLVNGTLTSQTANFINSFANNGCFDNIQSGEILTEYLAIVSIAGCDYVFYKDYDLIPIEKLKEYIDSCSHLPDIPPAQTMEKDGLNVNDFLMKLLKKQEESTLYIIQLKEEINNQNFILSNLEKRLSELEK